MVLAAWKETNVVYEVNGVITCGTTPINYSTRCLNVRPQFTLERENNSRDKNIKNNSFLSVY